MDIQQYLRALKNGWWIVVSALLISVGVAVAYSYSQPPIYEATTTLVANPSPQITQTGELIYGLDTLTGRSSLVTTYCDVLESQATFNSAAASLGLPEEIIAQYASSDKYTITCVVLPESSVLRLSVRASSPALAADLATALASVSINYVSSLQGVYELRTLDPASALPNPIAPDHTRDTLLGAVIGLLGGVAIIVVRQSLQDSIGQRSYVSALPAGMQAAPPLPDAPHGVRILIVEDYAEMAEMLALQLHMDGYEVKTAPNGVTALELAEGWRPQLVLLDIQLPDIDGFEVARRLREMDATAHIPIIMLTAKSSNVHKRIGFLAGADDYITKPPDLTDVSLRIAAHLRRAGMERRTSPPDTRPLGDLPVTLTAQGDEGLPSDNAAPARPHTG